MRLSYRLTALLAFGVVLQLSLLSMFDGLQRMVVGNDAETPLVAVLVSHAVALDWRPWNAGSILPSWVRSGAIRGCPRRARRCRRPA